MKRRAFIAALGGAAAWSTWRAGLSIMLREKHAHKFILGQAVEYTPFGSMRRPDFT
jgi:hypothetical protein